MIITYCRKYSWVIFSLGILLTGHSTDADEVRSAKVAGKFYPESQEQLQGVVNELLALQPAPTQTSKPRILIVPHAGYQYSGLIAANGFRQLQGRFYDGIVVIGFTHQVQFDGASVDTREAYDTPLGAFPIHQEAVAILQTYPGISHIESAHDSDEHSVEVELPFLQVVLPHTRLVPILMGNSRLQDAQQLAEALAGLSRLGDFLFVFSTDLSHYHPYDEAARIDEGTVSALLSETPQAVDRLFARGAIEACGRGPIVTSLLLAAALGYPQRTLLYQANSGDTAGDPTRVVGYAAIGMFDRPAGLGEGLPREAGDALVKAARESLERTIAQQDTLAATNLERYPVLSEARGVFVTLRRHGELRGCIGRIETTEPLAKTVPVVALDSALQDTRFVPVVATDLDELQIEVSVLTPPARITDSREIVPGRDGVVLEYQGHRGVFLPQVWDETGWTRMEFLQELASQKAGLPPDAWQQATLYTFQAQSFEEPLPLVRTAH